uniref:Uncharacterized protein n=1 Tax=viral metagenome TaxID=1070528 RepID=A0A6M3J1C8_9ZZZZ
MDRLICNPKFQAFDSNGLFLSGGKVYTYESGTTTPLATYSDRELNTANSNPIVLDSRGECQIFCNELLKLVLKDSDDIPIWTFDNIRPTDLSLLRDNDNDTKVQVEESADEDKIRFDTGGVERAVLDSSGFDIVSGGLGISGTFLTATFAEINKACDLTVNGFFATGNVNKMLFYLDTAPTGWSIDTSLDDKLVFVTKGSGAAGETGGGAHSSGSWTISGITVDSHTHSMQAHTHTIAHTHVVTIPFNGWSRGASVTLGEMLIENGSANQGHGNANRNITSDGSSAANSGGPSVADTGTASANGITSDATWRPAAYCCIVASLD